MVAEDWIRQLAAGDREAFRAIYNQYGETVYRRALAQTGNREKAQETLKSVFRTLFRQLRDSGGDPVLFLLEGLTDLQTGAPAASVPPENRPSDPPSPEDFANHTSQAAPVEEPAEEPAGEGPEPPRETLFDAAAERLEGEYEEASITPDQLDVPENGAPAAIPPADTEPPAAERPKRRRFLTVLLIVVFVILVLLTLWFGAGVLMMYSILPKVDLGYSWFNEHLFDLFRF